MHFTPSPRAKLQAAAIRDWQGFAMDPGHIDIHVHIQLPSCKLGKLEELFQKQKQIVAFIFATIQLSLDGVCTQAWIVFLLPSWDEPCCRHLDITNPEGVWKQWKRTVCPNLEATREFQEEEVKRTCRGRWYYKGSDCWPLSLMGPLSLDLFFPWTSIHIWFQDGWCWRSFLQAVNLIHKFFLAWINDRRAS